MLATALPACNNKKQGKSSQSRLSDSGTPIFKRVIERTQLIDQSGNPKGALKFLDSAYYTIHPSNIVDQYQYYYSAFNIYNRRLHNHEVASLYADTMLMLVEKNYNKVPLIRQYALANFSKGDVYFAEGNYQDAYVSYYKAWSLAENNLDSCELQDYNYRLGMVLYRQQRYNEAVENFKEAFGQSENCEHTFSLFYRRQELLDNAALAYYHMKFYDSALIFFNRALTFIDQRSKDYPGGTVAMCEEAKAVIYGNMASALSETGKTREAENLLIKSIEINTRKNYDNIDAQLTRLKLAALYFDKGNIGETYKLLQEVKTVLDTLPDKKVESRWYDMMWKYYDHEQQPQLALNYLLKYDRLNEKIAEENKQLAETDIKEKFKNIGTQYKIGILEKNNQLKKYYLTIMGLLVLICLSVVLFVVLNWRRSRRNIKTLTTFNDQINRQNIKLEQLLDELEESNNQKDRIMRTIAHDVRNPVAAISALSDLLLSEHSNYTEEQREMLLLIQEACSNTLTLTKDILESAQPDKQAELKKDWVSVNALLSSGVELLQFRAKEKRQQLHLSLLPQEQQLFINREQISRVISNLITNAIKFSPDGAKINIKAIDQGSNIQISVQDNGIGIPEELKDNIFDTFTNARREGTSGEKSFGLGLSISRQIMEKHGGKIWFVSEAGKGTTFYLTLPTT